MFGFIVGTVCAVALFKLLRRRYYFGPFGCTGHLSHGGYDDRWGPRTGWRHGFGGPRFWLRSIFERLETTPGQERAILSALDELRSNRAALEDEMKQTRADVARAIAGGMVDDATLEETFARHDRLLARLRVSFVEATKKINEVLDPNQRQRLAQMLEGRGWFGAGPRWRDSIQDVWA